MCIPLPLTSSSFVGRYFSTQGTSKSIELENTNSFNAHTSLEGCGGGSRLVWSSSQLAKAAHTLALSVHKSGPREFHYVTEAFALVKLSKLANSHKIIYDESPAHKYRPRWSKGVQAVLQPESGAPRLGYLSNERIKRRTDKRYDPRSPRRWRANIYVDCWLENNQVMEASIRHSYSPNRGTICNQRLKMRVAAV